MPIDESDTKRSGNFPVIPEGIYEATIERIEERTARSGNKYKHISFRLLGEKASEKGVSGRLVWDNIVLLKQVEWKVQNLLQACRLPYESSSGLSDEWRELLGRELRVYVSTREYQGTQQNDVKSFYPKLEREGPEISPPEEEPVIEEGPSEEEIDLEEAPF